MPATAPAEDGGEVFGYVSYTREHEGAQAARLRRARPTTPTRRRRANPDWTLDLSDHEIGHWRGPQGRRGVITLVWGVALVPNGVVATAELGPTTTDQCELVDDRFTLVSLDAYTGDYVEVAPVRRARRRAGPRVAVRGRLAPLRLPEDMVRGQRCVLLKFGELALKGRNRPRFVNALDATCAG